MRFRGRMICGETKGGKVVVGFNVAQIMEPRHAEVAANEIRNALVKSRVNILIIDFEGVRHMTSVMLGKLMQIKKAVDESEGQVRVCGLNDALTRLFKVSGFRKIFKVYATREAALKK